MLTVGDIARRCGEPIHRVEYVIKARGINPAGRVGNLRVYSEADADRIAEELAEIAYRKGGSAC